MRQNFFLSKEDSNMLKGLLALGVVMHHLAQRTETIFFIDLFEKLGAPIVSVFFFISGYGLLNSYINNKNYLKKFLSHRLPILLIPFASSIILFQIFSTLDNSTNSIIQICKSLITQGNTSQLLPFSWYVFCAIYLYLAFYFVFKFSKSDLVNKIGIIFFLSICYVVALKILSFGPYWYISIFGFSTGLLVKYFEKSTINLIDTRRLGFFIIFNIVLLIKLFGISHYTSMTLYPVSIMILIFIANIKENIIMKILGNISYEIYLLQGISIVFLRGNHVYIENDYLFIFLTILITIFISLISHYSINRYIYKRFHLTSKERS